MIVYRLVISGITPSSRSAYNVAAGGVLSSGFSMTTSFQFIELISSQSAMTTRTTTTYTFAAITGTSLTVTSALVTIHPSSTLTLGDTSYWLEDYSATDLKGSTTMGKGSWDAQVYKELERFITSSNYFYHHKQD